MGDLEMQDTTIQQELTARHPLTRSAQRLVKIATWVPAAVLGFLAFLFVYLWWAWLTGGTEPADLASGFVAVEENQNQSLQQPEHSGVVAAIIAVWFVSLSSIIVSLILSFLLLRGYSAGRIFELKQADRLRRIGWMMVLATPLMIIGKSINYFLINRAIGSAGDKLSIGIEHVDLLMLAFGMLIVVVGHVMRTALAIAEENENFV